MNKSKNTSILITGSSKGFGLLFAEALAQEGHRVFATLRDPTQDTPLKLLPAKYPNLSIHKLDVADYTQIGELLPQLGSEIGVLINNAGYGLIGTQAEITPEQLERQFRVNLFGAAELTRQTLPLLQKSQAGGLVINISSIASYLGLPTMGAYSATKTALNHLSMALAVEKGQEGLSVMVVQPGPFETEFRQSAQRVGVGEGQSHQSMFSAQEPPDKVVKLVCDLVRRKLEGRLGTYQEIPIGKGSLLLNLLARLLPPQALVKALARGFKKM
ncbi:MAG: SDR family NAD(P)-dependent oxidoreductase [Candidatus Caenarcaniphilales bacterium]|nr:SDR family NAD(P)-dependent oxidoreductase [Candidatus Caenarcaniphilales bacterium]